MMRMVDAAAPISGPWSAAPEVPSENKAGPGRQGGETPAVRRLKILIVEDEMFVAMYAEDILTAAGHDVVGNAASADQAIDKAGELLPDLILMDIRLQGSRDGIDAAGEICRRFDLPIIFVTANVDPLTHARAMQVNPLGIISKPFTSDSLLGAMEGITRG